MAGLAKSKRSGRSNTYSPSAITRNFEIGSSLSRLTGDITGTTFFGDLRSAKRLELLRQLARGSNLFGVLVNPKNPNAET